MSLSARIVLRPSRRLAAFEAALAIGGGIAAQTALMARWPSHAWPVCAIAGAILIACGFVAFKRVKRAAGHAITLSDHVEVGVMPVHEDVPVEHASWRIAEPTLTWPGFAVLGLQAEHGARLMLPVMTRELAEGDRRALQRFLLWTLRGGRGQRTVASEAA